MTMLIVQYPMHRTIFVAVSSLHFHLVEVEMQTVYTLAAKAAAATGTLQIAAHQVAMQVCVMLSNDVALSLLVH